MAAGSKIDGPLGGGTRGIYCASIVDLEPYGYEELEYVLEGHAAPLEPAADLTVDGQWLVRRGPARRYRTRLLVRRPPSDRFNGTVLVEFMQEYFGSERDTNFRWNAETILREGFAWVGASLHHEGIDAPGGAELSYREMTIRTGPPLVEWDPDRYGRARLAVPHSDCCYEILSDVARAVGPQRSSPVDPLDGLPVRAVIGVGNTIAAVRLQHYINAVHPVDRLFDGFYLQDLTDIGLPLAEGATMPAQPATRTDVDVPVIILQTQTAAMGTVPYPEGPNLRLWEVAGSSHTTGPYMQRVAEASKRDMGQDSPICPPDFANTLPLHYVSGAALVALHRWIVDGTAAPRFPPLDRAGEGPPFEEVVDGHGNVTGGVRTPWVDVPVARYDWRGDCFGGAGRTFWFAPEELARIHRTPEDYQEAFERSAREAEQRGVLLPLDVEEAIDAARKVTW